MDTEKPDVDKARAIAKTSMFAGIAAWTCFFIFFSFVWILNLFYHEPSSECVNVFIGVFFLTLVLGIYALRRGNAAIRFGDELPPGARRLAMVGIWSGRLVLALFLAAILAGMFLPARGSARQKARRISCAANLKQIGLALTQYSVDNGSCFPSGDSVACFELLRRLGYLSDNKIFVCTSSDLKPAYGNEPLTEKSLSYVYLGSGLKDSPENADKPLACDKPDNHSLYGNVLFCDGHVMGFPGTKWLESASQEKRSK